MKKNRRLSIAIVSILLAVAVFSSTVSNDLGTVEAATRFYGVQQIVEEINENDPFTIMEIVPDELYASMEAYVDGSQCNLSPELLATGTSKETRKEIVLNYYQNIAAHSTETDAKAYPLNYVAASVYTEQLTTPNDLTGWNILEFPEGYYESRHGSYVETGEGSDYIKTTVPVEDDTVTEDNETGSTDSEESVESETVEESGDNVGAVETVDVYTYNPGNGTYSWVDDMTVTEATEVELGKVYYKITLTSNEWFEKHILEANLAGGIEVVTVTPAQLEENLLNGYLAIENDRKILNWGEIDFLYISNTPVLNFTDDEIAAMDVYKHFATGESSNDITWDTAYAIYEYVVNTNLPVVLDSSVIPTTVTDVLLNADNNLLRLACLLKDYKTDTGISKYSFDTDAETGIVSWDAETTLDASTSAEVLLGSTADMGSMGSVQGSVYVDTSFDSVLGKLNLVNTGLNTVFQITTAIEKNETYIEGMSQIADEINTENFYNETHGADYTTEYSSDGKISISQATLVKYILNYAHRRIALYKDEITVLDVEPTKYSNLTEDTIRNWLDEETSKKVQTINIVQTTTSEFIGKVVDLNEKYDLIYIGDCIGFYKVTGTGNQTKVDGLHGSMKQSGGKTVFADTSMNGLIYTHVGDIGVAAHEYAGLLNGEVSSQKGVTSRFSGNDITKEKMEDLIAFVNSGYPVVIADKLIDGVKVNAEYVDNSSYMYQFMNTVINEDNVMSDKNITAATLARYINMPKLQISMISQPTEYEIEYADSSKLEIKENGITYLQPTASEKYNLNYTFELSDTSEAANDNTAYHVQLFVDTNADGQFSELEELDGLIVTEDVLGKEIAVNELVTGIRYTVSRELPADYKGLLPWKLLISMVVPEGEETTVRTTATGYTAVQVPENQKVKIEILQINSNSGTLSLKDDVFTRLFADLEKTMGYIVDPTEINVNSYVNLLNNKNFVQHPTDVNLAAKELYDNYLKNYDMLVLGFDDCYDDIASEAAVRAIKMFIESGKSVLFSHDTTSHINSSNKSAINAITYWGYHLNQYIRSIVGMDRYGITEDEPNTTDDLDFLKAGNKLAVYQTDSETGKNVYTSNIQSIIDYNKDIAFEPKSGGNTTVKEVHGFANNALDRDSFSSGEKAWYYTDTAFNVKKITQVNEGQITTFPYPLNLDSIEETSRQYTEKDSTKYYERQYETMAIEETHTQYYQLDMQMDKTGDGNSDIVVWYALADGLYDASPNDVRNNYYIYSVGNVTYTGMGHRGNITNDEAKLFVNTMVAALQSGKRTPSVSIVSSSTDKSKQLNYIYRTFDADTQIMDASGENIYFYVNDTNIINGTKTIQVEYYCEASSSTEEGAIATSVGGETVYLKLLGEDIVGAETVGNNLIATAVLNADWINSQLKDSASTKIYIEAKTVLDYVYENRENDETDEAYAYVTIKRRDMFDLD